MPGTGSEKHVLTVDALMFGRADTPTGRLRPAHHQKLAHHCIQLWLDAQSMTNNTQG